MNSPLVSIIVISYNQGKYIRENLDSIKNQTYTDIELIIGDDASADQSVEVFEKWLQENAYPAAFQNFHTKNTGLATILNECLEKATGKYIKLLAADDFLHPEAIEKCVAKLESVGEDYGMVFTDTYAIDDKSRILPDIADYDALGNVTAAEFRRLLPVGNRIAALTVLMRKTAVEKTGPYEAQFLVEDYYRWLRISQLYFVAYIPEKLAFYRQHEANVSAVRKERISTEDLLLKAMFDSTGVARDQINSGFSRHYKKGTLSKKMAEVYLQYSFGIRRLRWAIKYKVPPAIFTVVNKYV